LTFSEHDANTNNGIRSNNIGFERLVSLYELGFKLVPLGPKRNEKTGEIEAYNHPQLAWTPIYENPQYWSIEKLHSERRKFQDVGTVFGKSHLTDEDIENDGKRELYLHCLDVDSQAAYDRIAFRLEDLTRETFVVKTCKLYGYHIYWFEHEGHSSVMATHARPGCEFEIKANKSCGHSTLPPSRHREQRDFVYEAVGRTDKIAIIDGFYKQLKHEVLSDCIIITTIDSDSNKPPAIGVTNTGPLSALQPQVSSSSYSLTQQEKERGDCKALTANQIDELMILLIPCYKPGSRDEIVFSFTGMMAKYGIDLSSAKRVISELCDATGDNEKTTRLDTLQRNYDRAVTSSDVQSELPGTSRLYLAISKALKSKKGTIENDKVDDGNDALEVTQAAAQIIDKIRKVLTSKKRLGDNTAIVTPSSKNNENIEQDKRQQLELNREKYRHETVMKYSSIIDSNNKPVLWESVKIAGIPCFVSFTDGKLQEPKDMIVDDSKGLILEPYKENAIDQYTFASIDELEYFVNRAQKETLDSLWAITCGYVQAFIDTPDKSSYEIITADTIFSYFQDRLGMTHYLFLCGPPDTGKGSILGTMHQICYRAALTSNTMAAHVYRLLGRVEKGQITLLVDEANRLDEDPFLMEVCKVGYKGNSKIPRISDASSSDAKMDFYHTYSLKIIAAEHLPKESKAEAFLTRCLMIYTSPGVPRYKIDKVIEPAGDEEYEKIRAQLLYLRKLLFAYRLIHFSEPIPDVKLNITGRDEELCSSLIRLFKNAKALEIVKDTLYRFIIEKKNKKSQSLDAFICNIVKETLKDPGYIDVINRERGIEFTAIWNLLKEKLDGRDDPDSKDEEITTSKGNDAAPSHRQSYNNKQTMVTTLFGSISYRRLSKSLSQIGKKVRNHTGKKWVWQFDDQKLERFRAAYSEPPNSLEIVTKSETEREKGLKTLPLEEVFENSDSYESSDASEALEKRIGVHEEKVQSQNDGESISRYNEVSDKCKIDVDGLSQTSTENPELTPLEASEVSKASEVMESPQDPSKAQKDMKDLAEPVYIDTSSSGSKHNFDNANSKFFIDCYVAFDLEWKDDVADGNSKGNDKIIYAAAFVDNHGNQKVLHISDFAGSEPALLQAITDELLKYPASLGWYTTGIARGGGRSDTVTGGVSAAV
jgi:hypothetical protein